MTPITRNILVREALVILGIVAIGLLIYYTPSLYIKPKHTEIHQHKRITGVIPVIPKTSQEKTVPEQIYLEDAPARSPEQIAYQQKSDIQLFGLIFIFLAYPIYLFTRFMLIAAGKVKEE